ncbi:hypothetical protein [Hydrogenophaga taeniospiralis]|uniref:hypothetical protein n=1 Tax=Hydrogenophaga taeniospiralis TaxID=65656 RepID=UPI00082F9C0F|nr:hypothetical protein [Hydrogenophaga taeniospiralis]
MGADGIGLFLMLGSFVLTFFVARIIGKRLKARRDARQAQRELAGQSRQVRRAQARKNKG